MEQIALSFGLSITVMPVLGLLLSYTDDFVQKPFRSYAHISPWFDVSCRYKRFTRSLA